ncbi:MAG: hypothetical protein JW719_11150 [Pirellulales bacterium]|nr:hypothetical protein [Pirellulales bacterium]
METMPERHTALVELEALQDDLIARLDDLDHRVSQVLKQWTSTRQTETPPSPVQPHVSN